MSYTSQIIEPVRIGIGKMLISHEIIKLLQSSDYEEIKAKINHRWKELTDIISVRDFWNLVDSLMMGYKLKNIIRLVTSSQIDWDLDQTKIDDLRFTSDISKIEGFNVTRKTAKEVSTYLFEHNNTLMIVKEKNHQEFANAGSRTKDPIIVEKHTDSTLHVHDGNGRLLKAIVENIEVIDAYIGTQNHISKSNHWVPTSYLQRLSDDRCKELLISILRESDNAIFEFKDRVDVEEEFKLEILSEI
ncbi:MAG: hypothetical protein HYY87_02515 [Candidatus Levybacteria bacterium]|nr:hypothetical protein [Candidatus Levybacteria bacterium]